MHFKRILFPTDLEEGSAKTVSYAADLAKKYGARLYLIHVIHEVTKSSGMYVPHATFDELYKNMEIEAAKEIKSIYIEELRGFKDVSYTVKRGIPYEEIIRFAEENNIDLIVMGTHGRKGLDRILFGSTCDKVSKSGVCPVLVIPPEKSET
jgi:nucleotide-binding universal stress UspA family protein